MTNRSDVTPVYSREKSITPRYDFISLSNIWKLIEQEQAIFKERTPKSASIAIQAESHLHRGVISTWHLDQPAMGKFPNPLFTSHAKNNRMWDADGNEYVDFMLGDTAALFGHSPDTPVTHGVSEHILNNGFTTFLPDASSYKVGKLLQDRFGLRNWHAALSASDANRFAIHMSRMVSGRPKIMIFNKAYHGTVEECLKHTGSNGTEDAQWKAEIHPGQNPADYTTIVPFNDLAAVEEGLKQRDVAVLLTEPLNTNHGGLLFPAPGFHEKLRELCTQYGTYLLIDETHSQTSGPTGCLGLWNLKPDIYVLGKCIAGGAVPCGLYGFNDEIGDKLGGVLDDDPTLFAGNTGLGTTLSGNSLTVKALELSLQHNYTEETFGKMTNAMDYLVEGLNKVIERRDVPFHIDHLGARMSLNWTPERPENPPDAVRSAGFGGYHEYFTLYALNRGLAKMPMGGGILTGPLTTEQDCDLFVKLYDEVVMNMLGDTK